MEEKVYYPETITDTPMPNQAEASYDSSQASSGGVLNTTKISDNSLPTKKIAVELISTSLNTKSKKILGEFELVESGGFQIGKYQNGVSGDLRITPNGLTARDLAGITTFAIDGETGSAVFKGTVQAGTLIGGDSNVIITEEEGHGQIKFREGDKTAILLGWG
jgi:hypothetical protein